jgi:hypothetical protein
MALLWMPFVLLTCAVVVQLWMASSTKHIGKLVLDRAAHAASLYVDEHMLAQGALAWDEVRGRAAFFDNLRANLRLDDTNRPLRGSRLTDAPIVHELSFVRALHYPLRITRDIPVRDGDGQSFVRSIAVTVHGPSVVAVLEMRTRVGTVDRSIVVTSVASVRTL